MIVKHPTLKGVSYDVPEADVDRWKAQGWLAEEPSKPAAKKAAASRKK